MQKLPLQFRAGRTVWGFAVVTERANFFPKINFCYSVRTFGGCVEGWGGGEVIPFQKTVVRRKAGLATWGPNSSIYPHHRPQLFSILSPTSNTKYHSSAPSLTFLLTLLPKTCLVFVASALWIFVQPSQGNDGLVVRDQAGVWEKWVLDLP